MDESEEEECYGNELWMEDPLLMKEGSSKDKKRRFTDDQVKSLELMFETQTKLEPRKKLQLAKELGLHPRQVAIWFQNKRARWKSKQLEREYSALRADYDALSSKCESLKREKQTLSKQIKKLEELVEKSVEGRKKESSCSEDNQRVDTKLETVNDAEENRYVKFSENEMDFLSPIESSMEAPEHQFCFDQPSWPSTDQSCANIQWWEFWPMTEEKQISNVEE